MTIAAAFLLLILGGILSVFAFFAVEVIAILTNRKRRERVFNRGVVRSIKSALKAA